MVHCKKPESAVIGKRDGPKMKNEKWLYTISVSQG